MPARYYIRRVKYIREEFQVIDSKGNSKHYVDPEVGKGEFHSRQPTKEKLEVIEPIRLLTESEAGILGLPYEGPKSLLAIDMSTSIIHKD